MYDFEIEKVTVKAPSRALKAEYTLSIISEPMIFIGGRLWGGSTKHGIELIDDILKEEEAQTVKMTTEDGTILWEK